MVLKRVALTGASGMVGRHVIAELSRRGISCAATSRNRPQYLPENSTWQRWDLQDWKELQEFDMIFGTPDALFHVGALVPDGRYTIAAKDIIDCNVRATANLAGWAQARNIPFLYMSGATVYANPLREGIGEDDPKQEGNGVGGLYGLSKLLSEELLTALLPNTPVCILRPSSIYGFGLAENKMIPQWLDRASKGQAIEIIEPAHDALDLIHASDVARAMVDAVSNEAWGVFNIAQEQLVTIQTIAQMCVEIAHAGYVEIKKGDTNRPASIRFGLRCDRARAAFGFVPQVDLPTGIRRLFHKEMQ